MVRLFNRQAALWLLLLGLTESAFGGGPWVTSKNRTQFIFSVSPLVYRTISPEGGGQLSLPRRVTDINSQLYVEYGLLPSASVFGHLNFKVARTSSQTFNTNDFTSTPPMGSVFGLGNSVVGAKYNFIESKFLATLSAAVEFPAIGDEPNTGLRTGYNTYSFIPGIHFGQSLNKLYYSVETFFALRNELSHEWRLNAEIGYHFKKPLTGAFKVNMVESLRNRTISESPNYLATGLYLNNQEYVAWSINFIHDIEADFQMLYALAGGFTTSLIARTPVFTLGILYNL